MLKTLLLLMVLMPLPDFAVQCRELAIIAGTEEAADSFLKYELLQALSERSFPIMADASVVLFLVDEACDLFNKITAGNVHRDLKNGMGWAYTAAQITKRVEEKRPELEKILLKPEHIAGKAVYFRAVYIDFANQWHVYKVKGASSATLLLIPKNYLKKFGDDLERCGFQADNLDIINVRTDRELKDNLVGLRDDLLAHPQQIPFEDAFQKIVAPRALPEVSAKGGVLPVDLDVPWIFYWSGHGGAPQRGGGLTPGNRAGVSFAAFENVVVYMVSAITTKFLYFKSCFSGGVNQSFVKDMLKDLKAPFMVASVGTAENWTYAEDPRVPLILDARGQVMFSHGSRFSHFFSLVCCYFEAPKDFVKAKGVGVHPLVAILNSFASRSETNQPFIFIPQVGVFEAVSLDKKVYVLTDARARAAALEGTLIDVTGYQVTLVLPAYIQAPLYVPSQVGKKIISQRPLEVSMPFYKGATHVFEEIIPQAARPDVQVYFAVLCGLINANPSLYKLFLIKKVGKDNAPMQHVIIRLQGYAGALSKIGGKIDFWYQDTVDKKTYCSMLLVSNFEDRVALPLWRARAEASPDQLIALATQTVERFARADQLLSKPDKTKEEAALVQEFEAFKKHASLPLLFDILSQELKREIRFEEVEKQKNLGTILKERSAKSKPLPGGASMPL